MFRNSIKEDGEPSLEATSLPRRDSLSRLHDAIKSASVDGRVSCQVQFVIEPQLAAFFLIENLIHIKLK